MFRRLFRYLKALMTGRLDRWEDPDPMLAAAGRRLRELHTECAQCERNTESMERAAIQAEESGDLAAAKRLRTDLEASREALTRLHVRAQEAEAALRALLQGSVSLTDTGRPHAAGVWSIPRKDDGAAPLHYHGRDKRGVPIYDGSRGGLVNGEGVLILLGGTSMFQAFIIGTSIAWWMLGVEIFLILNAFYGLRRRSRLRSIEEIAAQFNVSEPTCLLLAQGRGLKPRMIVNGCEYFDTRDFDEAAILLRAASTPESNEAALLRPALNASSDPESLLRPASTGDPPK